MLKREAPEEGEIVGDDNKASTSSWALFVQTSEGGGYFKWDSVRAGNHYLPGHSGREGRRTTRHLSMEDVEGREPQFVLVPKTLFKKCKKVRAGLLTQFAKPYSAYPSSREFFDGVFLRPIADETKINPPHYAVETTRQRNLVRDVGYSSWQGEGKFRGNVQTIKHFVRWSGYILRQHKETLENAGIFEAIECTRARFDFKPSVIAAFLPFWSTVTNSFHFPSGEMSITLWDLYAFCGLPISGAPFFEHTPSDKNFEKMDLANRLFCIWVRVRVQGKCHFSQWANLFGRISDPERADELYPQKPGPKVKRMWMDKESLYAIKPDEE